MIKINILKIKLVKFTIFFFLSNFLFLSNLNPMSMIMVLGTDLPSIHDHILIWGLFFKNLYRNRRGYFWRIHIGIGGILLSVMIRCNGLWEYDPWVWWQISYKFIITMSDIMKTDIVANAMVVDLVSKVRKTIMWMLYTLKKINGCLLWVVRSWNSI